MRIGAGDLHPEQQHSPGRCTASSDYRPGLRRCATVRYLQTLLVERFGYQIAIDSDFGSATAAAVQSFKQSNNLGGNAEVDGDTWRALQTADAQSS
jgi:peptidoglycan hydrolase-like protein with peptidoglycan-binding domain